MNEHGLKVGDVVWEMRGIQMNGETKWSARPMCIEKVTEHMFLDAWNCGGSWNSIGKNYFLTREDALKHFEAHKDSYGKPAVTSAMLHQPTRLGEKVKDEKKLWLGENIIRVFVSKGLTGIEMLDSAVLPWQRCEKSADGPETFVTLGDIRELLGSRKIITVWVDGPLHGEVYQTGNYPGEKDWRLYGQLMGYA